MVIFSNLSKRERYIFIFTIGVIVLALAYNFILEPILKNRATLNNEITIKKTSLRKGKKLLDNRNLIIKEYNESVSSLKSMSKILSYIEGQANGLGIKTANIKPRPVLQKELYREYVIELQIEGRFTDIIEFISELIKPPLGIIVKKLDLRAPKEASSYLKGTLVLSKLAI